MVALLQRAYAYAESCFSWQTSAREPQHQGSYPGELTDDQVAYLHEAAADRRRKWMEHSREA